MAVSLLRFRMLVIGAPSMKPTSRYIGKLAILACFVVFWSCPGFAATGENGTGCFRSWACLTATLGREGDVCHANAVGVDELVHDFAVVDDGVDCASGSIQGSLIVSEKWDAGNNASLINKGLKAGTCHTWVIPPEAIRNTSCGSEDNHG
jgi:hypothetical protein